MHCNGNEFSRDAAMYDKHLITIIAALTLLSSGTARGEEDDGRVNGSEGSPSRDVISISTLISDEGTQGSASDLADTPDSKPELWCGESGGRGSCDCGPSWTATLDILFLQRRQPAAAELMFNTNAPAQNLNASDFDFGFDPGVDLSVARQFSDRLGLEVRYFGMDAWNEATNVATTAGDPLRINTVPLLLTPAGDAIQARYRSDLNNLEINTQLAARDWLTMLGGFRYLELDERFAAALPGADVPFAYEAATRNRLYGVQLGARACLWNAGGPLSIEGLGKAGIYGNASAQDSRFSTGIVTLPAHDARTATAFIGEAGLSANYCLTERLSVRAGYRLLWVAGVALASDQVAVSDFVFDRGLNSSGDAFYHGAFAGLQYAY